LVLGRGAALENLRTFGAVITVILIQASNLAEPGEAIIETGAVDAQFS